MCNIIFLYFIVLKLPLSVLFLSLFLIAVKNYGCLTSLPLFSLLKLINSY